MVQVMRMRLVFGCSAALLVGCERRGYAPMPEVPSYGARPVGYDPSTLGAAWDSDPRVSAVPGWESSSRAPSGPLLFPSDGGRSQVADRGAHAAHAAISLYGRPYCWGGTGPDCYDCSGLTFSAWHAVGLNIPRTSELQREKLPPVAMNDLRPGDILWRPGHVGMYVGNGWAIHAPGSGKPVQYQPAGKFDEARRPF